MNIAAIPDFSPAASIAVFAFGASLPTWVVLFCATILIWLLVVYVLLLSVRARLVLRTIAFRYTAIVLIAIGANTIIEWFFFRSRPFVALGFDPVVHVSIYSGSFPSDHAAVAWVIAVFAALQLKKSRPLFIGSALLISFGRVLAGVHYLSDIAAGAIVGTAVGVVMDYYFVRMHGSWLTRVKERLLGDRRV